MSRARSDLGSGLGLGLESSCSRGRVIGRYLRFLGQIWVSGGFLGSGSSQILGKGQVKS